MILVDCEKKNRVVEVTWSEFCANDDSNLKVSLNFYRTKSGDEIVHFAKKYIGKELPISTHDANCRVYARIWQFGVLPPRPGSNPLDVTDQTVKKLF